MFVPCPAHSSKLRWFSDQPMVICATSWWFVSWGHSTGCARPQAVQYTNMEKPSRPRLLQEGFSFTSRQDASGAQPSAAPAAKEPTTKDSGRLTDRARRSSTRTATALRTKKSECCSAMRTEASARS